MTNDRPSRRVMVDEFQPLQVIRYILRLESLLLAVPFILIWSFVLASTVAVSGPGGTFALVRSTITLYLTLTSFFCYLMIVLDYTARGYQAPPKISGDLITENRSKFGKAVLVVSFFLSVAVTLGESDWLSVVVVFGAIFLPVIFSIIAIQDNFINAMNPIVWFGFITAIKWDRFLLFYLLGYVLLALALHALSELDSAAMVIPVVTALTFTSLTLFRLIGILVHANAEALGMRVRFGNSVQSSQEAENKRREETDFVSELYRLSEARKNPEAFEQYQAYIKKNDAETTSRLWPTISQWPNPALMLLAGQAYIETLVADQNYRLAWQVLLQCFERNNQAFKLLNGTTTIALCDCAATSQERQIAAELLRFFATDFPNHPEEVRASFKAVELLLNIDENSLAAKRLLQSTKIKHPEIAKLPEYQRLGKLCGLR